MSDEEILQCSFCERSSDQRGVRIVVVGSNGAAICTSCADLAHEEMARQPFVPVEIVKGRKPLASIEVTLYGLDNDYETAYWGGREADTEPVKDAVRHALGELSTTFDVIGPDPES
jgi:hypothetical protein